MFVVCYLHPLFLWRKRASKIGPGVVVFHLIHGRAGGLATKLLSIYRSFSQEKKALPFLRFDIRVLAPKALLLNAESNERDPHVSMRVMGEKLAKEVHR